MVGETERRCVFEKLNLNSELLKTRAKQAIAALVGGMGDLSKHRQDLEHVGSFKTHSPERAQARCLRIELNGP